MTPPETMINFGPEVFGKMGPFLTKKFALFLAGQTSYKLILACPKRHLSRQFMTHSFARKSLLTHKGGDVEFISRFAGACDKRLCRKL